MPPLARRARLALLVVPLEKLVPRALRVQLVPPRVRQGTQVQRELDFSATLVELVELARREQLSATRARRAT